jgi:hypothetical protein
MASTNPLGIPMDRMGSGTTWIPDAVALPSRHFMLGDWSLMLHGFVFLEYNKQGGLRGDDWFGSSNWGMLMASRPLAGGRFEARTMLSLDPATVTSRGYPLLLQTGETYQGEPLHDRQHPHDLFKELAVLYDRELTPNVAASVYLAPSGEPALGPVAFMHRPSAMDNPVAPLGHHWQDATHISFGVVTLGLYGRRLKFEGSLFNGTEPDEYRWDIDPIELNSYSARLTANPDSQWSLTFGYGKLKMEETTAHSDHGDGSEDRLVVSVLNGRKLGRAGQLATTVLWAANAHSGERLSHSLLVESEAILDAKNTVLGRAEVVQKSAADLVLPSSFDSTRTFNVAHISLGYIREIVRLGGATIGAGAMGTLNFVTSDLEQTYGSQWPVGAVVFLRLRPSRVE